MLRQPQEKCLLTAGVLHAAAQAMAPGLFRPFVKALVANCSAVAAPGPIRLSDVLDRTYSTECPGLSKDTLSAFRRLLWPRHSTVAELEGYVGILTSGSGSLSHMEPRERTVNKAAVGVVKSHTASAGAPRLVSLAALPGCTSHLHTASAITSRGSSRCMPATHATPCSQPPTCCCHAGLRRVLDSVLAQESEDVRVAVLQHFVDKGITKLASAPGTIGEAMPAHPSFRSLILLRLAGRPASSSC